MFRTSSSVDIMCLSLVNNNSNSSESSVDVVGKGCYLTATALGPPELVSLGDNSELSSSSSYSSFGALAGEGSCSNSPSANAAVEEEAAASNFGKRRKTSRADSPSSSVFDVASLVDAIHREVEGPFVAHQADNANTTDGDGDDTFAFIDIFESEAAPERLGVPCLDGLKEASPSMPTLNRRPSGGALGKRNRGLVRSQTVAIDLCLLGGD